MAALRTVLMPRVDGERLRSSLADAVLLDELAMLPEAQQRVVQAVHREHLSLDAAADQLGLAPIEAAGLLRQALVTLSANT